MKTDLLITYLVIIEVHIIDMYSSCLIPFCRDFHLCKLDFPTCCSFKFGGGESPQPLNIS